MATRRLASKYNIDIDGSIDGLRKARKQAEAELNKLSVAAGGVGKKVTAGLAVLSRGGVLGGLGAAVGTAALGLNSVANELDEVAKSARAAGTSVEFMSGIRFAAQSAGIEINAAATAIQKVTKRLQEAQTGSTEAAKGFDLLGIDPKQFQNTEEAVLGIAEAFKNTTNNQRRITALFKLFEESGPKFANLFAGGEEGLRRIFDQAERSGRVFTAEDTAQAERYKDAVLGIQESLRGIGTTIGTSVLPAVAEFLERVNDLNAIQANVSSGGFAQLGQLIAPSDDVQQAAADVESYQQRLEQLRTTLDKNLAQGGAIGTVASFFTKNQIATAEDNLKSALVVLENVEKQLNKTLTAQGIGEDDGDGPGLPTNTIDQDAIKRAQKTARDIAKARLQASAAARKTESQNIIAANNVDISVLKDGLAQQLEAFKDNYEQRREIIAEFYQKITVEQQVSSVTAIDAIKDQQARINQQIAQERTGLTGDAKTNPAIERLRGQYAQLDAQITAENIKYRNVVLTTEREIRDAVRLTNEEQLELGKQRREAFAELTNELLSETGDGSAARRAEDIAQINELEKISAQNRTDNEQLLIDKLRETQRLREQILEIQQEQDAIDQSADAQSANIESAFNRGLLTSIQYNKELEAIEQNRLTLQREQLRNALAVAQAQSNAPEVARLQSVLTQINAATQVLGEAQQFVKDTLVTNFSDFFQSFGDSAIDSADRFRNLFKGITDSILERLSNDFAEQIYAGISRGLQQAASDNSGGGFGGFIQALFGAYSGSGGGADAFGGGEFASGGHVRGPGTATSDSIPARLSDGEYVQRTKAVNYYGADFMAALNNLKLPRNVMRGLSGFSSGGLAKVVGKYGQQKFAQGGLARVPSTSENTGLQPQVTVTHVNNGTAQEVTDTSLQRSDDDANWVISIVTDDIRRNGRANQARNNTRSRSRGFR